nr:hypothetical protein [Tanacetum cinerariifolium]
MTASTQALIDTFKARSPLFPLPPTNPTYDQAPLGHRAAMICMRDDILEEDMPPQRRFVLTAPSPGCDVAESSAAAARPPRGQYNFVDTVEADKVRRQESEDFYTQLHDAQTNCRDIRLQIDVVRGQMTAYETELHESAEDLAFRQMMRIHVLEARAQIDTVEDTVIIIISICIDIVIISHELQRNSTHTQDDGSQSSGGGLKRHVQPARVCSYTDFMKCQPLNFKGTEGVVRLSQWLKKMESVFHISSCTVDNQRTLKKKLTEKYCPKGENKKLEIKLWNLKVRGNDVAAYTQRFQELALMCTKFLADETEKIDMYTGGPPKHPWKCHQNVAREYTASPGEKKAYTGNLPQCTKCNYHHIRQCAPKYENCKRYGHTTSDCQVKTNNNNNMNQKAWACYECGNTRNIKKNCLKLKNHRNGNGSGVAQGKVYALGGRDASPDSNVITGAAPVAWAPYRLAPSKMKELAKQLQELSDKGLIRPNSSP